MKESNLLPMLKWFRVIGAPVFVAILLCLHVSVAQVSEEPIEYITHYRMALTQEPVYGIFDLGHKSSVRLTTKTLHKSELRFRLYGRHYVIPVLEPFYIQATFLDVDGQVIGQSPRKRFLLPATMGKHYWFDGLENLVGLYGEQVVVFTVPQGTSVIELFGTGQDPTTPPNRLLGYISHIEQP